MMSRWQSRLVDDDGKVSLVGQAEMAVEPLLLLGNGVRSQYRSSPVSPTATTPGWSTSSVIDGPVVVARLRPRRWDGCRPPRTGRGGSGQVRPRAALVAAVVPMAMICTTPAASARFSTSSRSARSRGRPDARAYRRAEETRCVGRVHDLAAPRAGGVWRHPAGYRRVFRLATGLDSMPAASWLFW